VNPLRSSQESEAFRRIESQVEETASVGDVAVPQLQLDKLPG